MAKSRQQKIVVVGAGGFGRETLDVLLSSQRVSNKWQILGFVDDDAEKADEEYAGYRVLGSIDWLARQRRPREIAVLIAVGNNDSRRRIAQRISDIGCQFGTVMHPQSTMTDSVGLGKDVIIAAGCILTNRIRIGNHVIINLDVTVGHDVILEDFVNLNPGVHINGATVVGEGAYVGTGAVTIQNVRVGRWSVIGAGAVVIDDIPDYSLAVGVPARVKKIANNPSE